MKKRLLSISLVLILVLSLVSCSAKPVENASLKAEEDNYRNFYEIFVYSFCDSDGDGIGDIKGVTSKLDYIRELGYDAIWLMPIMPSTTYHKYDVIDYYDIDPQYGTMKDFEELIKECDKRDIKVLIELMLNHSSSENEWFKEAVKAINNGSESKYTEYYHFVDTMPSTGKYSNKGLNKGFYECQFVEFMPDLNFDSELVREEFKNIAKFWIDKGVDGFRLDAIKHVYEGDNEKNIELCKWFNEYCHSLNENMYIVGEVWDTESTYLPYYAGDFTSLFNFKIGTGEGLVAMYIRNGQGGKLAEKIQLNQEKIRAVNQNGIDAVFLTNHDNNRFADVVESDPDMLRLAASTYLMMPGTIFTYYGEEIGMTGSGADENKRGPMLWSAEDSTGICDGPDNMSVDTSPADKTGVAEQNADSASLLNFYKALMAIRNAHPEIAKGTVTAIDTGDSSICAYQSDYNGSAVTVYHNFSTEEKQIAIGDAEAKLLDSLTHSSDLSVTLENGVLTLPAYGLAII